MTEAMCWRDLHDPNIGGKMDIDDYYKLAEAAGLPKKDIEELVRIRALERMRKDVKP
jgi:hypothetical protein